MEDVYAAGEVCWIVDLPIAMRAIFGNDARFPQERVLEQIQHYAHQYGMDEALPEPPQESLVERAQRLGVEESTQTAVGNDEELPPIAQPWSLEDMQRQELTSADRHKWRVLDLFAPHPEHMGWSLLVERVQEQYAPQALISFEQWWEARAADYKLAHVPLMEAAQRNIRCLHLGGEKREASFYEITRLGLVLTTYRRDGLGWRVASMLQERHFPRAAPPAAQLRQIANGVRALALKPSAAPPAARSLPPSPAPPAALPARVVSPAPPEPAAPVAPKAPQAIAANPLAKHAQNLAILRSTTKKPVTPAPSSDASHLPSQTNKAHNDPHYASLIKAAMAVKKGRASDHD